MDGYAQTERQLGEGKQKGNIVLQLRSPALQPSSSLVWD